ncbi:MAG: 4-phosphoerythronate dehydrogenase [Bacteroidota bacterium]|nr:4-phosphoerythronate dehydrogenase [Bacteroidota bacterium]
MRIVVDKYIPSVVQAFQQFGEVCALETAEITTEAVHNAEILIIRSETKVTKELLEGSAVRFVGSATIGTDHVDIEYLKSKSIEFASAPGSNANSVAEYVVAALLHLSQKKSFSLQGKSIGVVGIGNIGSIVVRYASALGMTVLQNDPPLARETGNTNLLPLDSLMECDFITLHVPLTKTGEDTTLHLFSQERISKMKKGTVLINTSRGPVVDGNALKRILDTKHLDGAVLDVWENEPLIDIGLLQKVDIGTPHIAGYSFDGKVTAVKMLYDDACRLFKQPIIWSPELNGTGSIQKSIIVESIGHESEKNIYDVVRYCYDIETDDVELRTMASLPEDEHRSYFRRLRSEYRLRREFFNTSVVGSPDALVDTLCNIGFK